MKTLWLEVTGGEPLQQWQAFREEYTRCQQVWHKFATSIGAIASFSFPGEAPRAFKFRHNETPEGWKAGDRDGRSSPYARRKDLWAPIEALPAPRAADDIAAETGLPLSLNYREPPNEPGGFEPHGSERVSAGYSFRCWSPAWFASTGPIFLRGGDWLDRAVELEAKGAAVTLTPNNPRAIPGGYTRVLEQYVDLAKAQANYARATNPETANV